MRCFEVTQPTRTPRARTRSRPVFRILAVAALTASAGEPPVTNLPPAAAKHVEFAREIRPIFEASCLSCHGPERPKSGYRLDTRAAALQGGSSYSPAIKPGDAPGSPLLQIVAGLVTDLRMPPKGEPLTAEQIGLLRAWIEQGAAWTEEGAAEPDRIASHWAFQPVRRPDPPDLARVSHTEMGATGDPPANPIDAFVRARLSAQGLQASPEADPVSLIRRLYLVMLGMPPTPEEVAAFVADSAAEAFERLVDRILADPRYGERWGRHWLDVIRFAESNGFETNRERPNAWRFRDYVIEAFNRDTPYDRFIREQLAGDALGVDVATGFLVAGAVDIVGSPDPVLTAQQRADELDDMVSTTGTAFLGLTVGCVRCHAHKFDPIAHREYYALTAVFSGVRHGDRPLPLDAAQQSEVARLDAAIQLLERNLVPWLAPPATTNAAPTRTSQALRPPVNAVRNEEVFAPVEATFVRFTILASSSGEPCLDELEVWAGDRNVALASVGTTASASGTLPGYAIHQLEHLNDGRVGNSHSWISNEPGRGWVQLSFARPERIARIVWGRDREGKFADRVPTQYRIEVGVPSGPAQVVAGSEDHEPFPAKSEAPAGPVYRFDRGQAAEAAQAREWLAELERTRKARAEAAKAPEVYAGTFTEPGLTYRLQRGDPRQPKELVPPGTLAVFQPLTLATNTPEQERRVRLADWITDPHNPLTARVWVNRLWQYHFGVGLVDTPNDFGRNGARPSHPELLDWLASELVARGWSTKAIHRLILTSATWRQSSAPRAEALAVDAGSRLLWRFPPRRLEAEAIRDTMLAVSGDLDLTRGGPSFHLHDVDRENVYHYHPKDEFGSAESRRMVYAFKVRMEPDGVFGAFDCPDGSLVTPKRSVSTTPLQALNLFNSRFTAQQAAHFAKRLEREAGPDASARIPRAWQLAFDRPPEPSELAEAGQFVAAQGLEALCRAVLNANELLFIP